MVWNLRIGTYVFDWISNIAVVVAVAVALVGFRKLVFLIVFGGAALAIAFVCYMLAWGLHDIGLWPN